MKSKYLIAVTGADGSGKSSLIKALAAEPLRNTKMIPIYSTYNKSNSANDSNSPEEILPPRPVIISILKLVKAGVQWLFEFTFQYAPQILRGNIVLCDRFYLDELLLTPQKYRYNAPTRITQFVRNILPHPGLYILLDAPEEVLYARKQDYSVEDLSQFRAVFLEWIKSQPALRVLDASPPLNEVALEAKTVIQNWLDEQI